MLSGCYRIRRACRKCSAISATTASPSVRTGGCPRASGDLGRLVLGERHHPPQPVVQPVGIDRVPTDPIQSGLQRVVVGAGWRTAGPTDRSQEPTDLFVLFAQSD